MPSSASINGHTVGDIVAAFLTHNPARTRADQVLRQRILEFCEHFGSKPTTDCTPADLILWIDSRQNRFRSDWTRLGVANNIKRPFNWAAKTARMIPYNPFETVNMPEGEPAREMEQSEFRLILRSSKAVFRRIVVFLRFSGCRPSEAADMEWSHFDESRGCITLWKHKTLRSRRQKRPRIVVLHPVAIKLLLWIKRNRPHDVWVFVNSRRTKWSRYTLGKRIKRLRNKLGCTSLRSLGGLRHAMGCDAVKNGVPLPLVSEILGHTNIRTTMRYVHVGSVELIRKAVIQAMNGKK